MKFFKKNIFWILILAGLILRVMIVFWSLNFRENTDILRWKDWARIAVTYGRAATYSAKYLTFGTLPNNMPPGTLYTISSVYWVWLTVGKVLNLCCGIAPGSNTWINGPFLTLLLRIPSLSADLAIFGLLYLLSKKYSRKLALVAAGLWYFNPIVIYNSALWGQMDALVNLFFLAAVYFLFQKKYFWSGTVLALSLLVKFSLLFTFPLFFLLVFLNRKRLKPIGLFFSGLILTTILFILPVSASPINWYSQFFLKNFSGEMQNISCFALNFWWVIFRPQILLLEADNWFNRAEIRLINSPLVSEKFFSLPLFCWALLVFSVLLIPLFRKIIKHRKINPLATINYFVILSLVTYLFFPKMHERYLYPVFALLTVLIGFGIPVFWEFVALSIVNFVNLLIVWHPMPLPIWLYALLGNINFQWTLAVLVLVSGISLLRKLIKSNVILT